MSLYTNNTDVSISDMARLTFYEIIDGERTEIVSLSMRIEHLENLAKAITDTLNQHKTNSK